jgi:phenylalanyl-tRNA synthetase beta chain
MKILTTWLRSYLPGLAATDAELAEALTLRGIAVEGVFDLTAEHGAGAGSLFEMDITTNRVDAMNHYGIAREAAVIYGLTLKPLEQALPPEQAGEPFPVRVEAGAEALCGRFTARVLRGIRVAASSSVPGSEVARRFALLGQKQISNAVDATNYVTQAMGQPTHAFDLDAVEGGIVVRRARAGERLRTLDGVDRVLDADDLVIADERRALSIAGVMGGWDSMITPGTRNVLVEAAWFDPASVRRSARRHGLHTDASHRFERGADFEAAPAASALVSRLILAAGGYVSGPMVDLRQAGAESRTVGRPAVGLSMGEVRRILGPVEHAGGILAGEVSAILTGLGCVVANAADHGGSWRDQAPKASADPSRAVDGPNEPAPVGDGQVFSVSLPSWRLDLEREIDLLEEVARVYGYDRFLKTLPDFAGVVREQPQAAALRALRRVLLGGGWSEAISSTFVSEADAKLFAPQPGTAIPMENPLSEEAGMLRPSLVPGMLTMLGHNLRHGVEDAALFELGTVFTGMGASATDRVEERVSLAFGAVGRLGDVPVDFFAAKGIVEAVAARFTARLHYFDRFAPESGLMPRWLHPGRSARLVMDGSTIGFFGQLHPEEAARRKLKASVVVGELRVDRLLALGLRHPVPRELSRFQPVRRDFSFLLPAEVPYSAVAESLRGLKIAELERFEPGERLEDATGARVPVGEYSLLLRTVFQSADRTLREEELQGWAQGIQAAVGALGGRLRS